MQTIEIIPQKLGGWAVSRPCWEALPGLLGIQECVVVVFDKSFVTGLCPLWRAPSACDRQDSG